MTAQPKPIGPTFGLELEAAGVTGFAINFGSDGTITYPNGATDAQKAAVQAVYVAHDPTVALVAQPTISDRQFFQQLAVVKVITQDDALAAVKTGAVPAAMEALIDALPADRQFGAKMLLSGATTFDRYNALTTEFGQMYGWTASDLDALWVAAAAL